LRRFLAGCLTLLLCSCDIEPIAVGVWDVETESGNVPEAAVWRITDPPALTIEGIRSIEADSVAFTGSRLSWSSNSSTIAALPDDAPVNFAGTIDGNRLVGTLYTQLGNFTVNGTRRRDSD